MIINSFRIKQFHYDGKGIGLYLIKGMVESNGGSVDVDSRPGEGTTFVFDLISYA